MTERKTRAFSNEYSFFVCFHNHCFVGTLCSCGSLCVPLSPFVVAHQKSNGQMRFVFTRKS